MKGGDQRIKETVAGYHCTCIDGFFTGQFQGRVSPAFAAAGDITRVTVDSSGAQANGGSENADISGDGRFVAFRSGAGNLVSGDTNLTDDIFVRDRQTGQTSRVSVASSGIQVNAGSDAPAISSDGRFVAFSSYASNLVDVDSNGAIDIFVHDRQNEQTTRVSVDSSGIEANSDSSEYDVAISGDGRFVAFVSDASNLVSDDTNGVSDVFVHDRQTGLTTRISIDSSGIQANNASNAAAISADGRYVTFSSIASNHMNNLRDVFVHDRLSEATTRLSFNSSGVQEDGGGSSPDISGNGRYVVFKSKSDNLAPGAADYDALIYVHDRQSGQTSLASAYSGGGIMEVGIVEQPAISSNGRYVSFALYEKDNNDGILNIWVRDLQMGLSSEVAYTNGSSYGPALSADGKLVAFWSNASNLVSGDTNNASDVFVHEVAFAPDSSPAVVSVSKNCGGECTYPTPASIAFTVIFSETVSGVTNDDFTLTADGVSGASITGVSGSEVEYTVTVETGTGDGTLRLNVVDNDSILDSNLNPLGGVGAGNGNFNTGDQYLIDKSTPTVNVITPADVNPTSAEFVHFTVTFSEKVLGVDASDFSLALTGGIASAGVTEVTGSANTYSVTVNTGNGDGILRLDLVDNDSIVDYADIPLAGPGIGNGNFDIGEIYTITKTTPTVPSVSSSLRANPNPTLADLVSFTVVFSEPVTGVDPDDFSVLTTGNLTGAFLANASGSGTTYTVIAATGSGEGGLRLDVLDNDSIVNTSDSPLVGPGPGKGNFITGEAYTLDKIVPYVSSSLRADANPTTAAGVSFTVIFSEAVSGVDGSDFILPTGGNISGAAITGINGAGNLYIVTASTGSGDGTPRLDVLDDDSIRDAIGNPLGGAGLGNGNFTAGEVYTLNRAPMTLFTDTIRSDGKNDGWVVESSEDSNQGGQKDSNDPTIILGDDAQDRQVRAILHFPTHYIPNNAVITRALVMIRGEGIVGSNPFDAHQNIVVDIRSGAFGFIGRSPTGDSKPQISRVRLTWTRLA